MADEEIKNTAETAAEQAPEAAAAPKQRAKSGRNIPSGIAYVLATFNNPEQKNFNRYG